MMHVTSWVSLGERLETNHEHAAMLQTLQAVLAISDSQACIMHS